MLFVSLSVSAKKESNLYKNTLSYTFEPFFKKLRKGKHKISCVGRKGCLNTHLFLSSRFSFKWLEVKCAFLEKEND